MGQVFTLLDDVQGNNVDEIDELMNDFDTEFIAPEEIKLTELTELTYIRSECSYC